MDTFHDHSSLKDEKWKIHFLIRKPDIKEHDRYTNYTLPKNAPDFTITEIEEKLSQVFGYLFNIHITETCKE